ncbi:2-oxo acid dehydrogenase subunit E2 [Riemerella anatipestifer]|uniref:Dihydrolipoamide acetyltransferase component of pyruvate dehydrogenase complex n=1 Tax=Riemerella anatipestifer RA-CH-1 TaxID=1228997 RepID=J9R3R5_RIEAN|nr:2-oxo acid dehydrogenase subunit E2 [Riemerella anatipestifer]AFR34718.1 Pyruvate/2-oxoglutarate dehydrogenase complex, dihydrolipoamide acyltransferase (E2) component,-related enzyme [Riemerella anatipestifer RA-CH-1]AIH01714.1 catalytic domain-containing protein of dehydrogenase complex [Riemerella anatipestifer CH3]MCO7331526.1 2-oxo acid dehydrogenase subunit E2 [Riemerella anatipestifer]MCO7350414.1 2-oxo acid dehydrogenase subunit E2 [Riemerella anatipestifer]MCQ4037862.1 2-oxo acid d
MAEIITMPRLSDTMTEGKVSKWHKQVGDAVKEGDILAEIETDKAVQDFESEVNGTLLYVGVSEGNAAPVDTILAIIGKEGEDISGLVGGNQSTPQPASSENTSVENTVTEATSSVEIPKGVEVINMPRLSDTMTEGKVAKWNKNVGDAVKEGDILAEIETDKAVQDFESEFNGTLLYQGVGEGEAAEVDKILAIIGPAGTDVSAIVSNGGVVSKPQAQQEQSSIASSAKAENVSTSNASVSTDRVAISPLARKMAEEKGIDITNLKGSGENGRIVKKDIENYQPNATEQRSASVTPAAQVAMNFVAGETTETPNSQVRNVIAKRLSESKFSAPHYYLMVEVNMDKAITARKEINSLPDTKVSFNDMVIKATAMALRKHPQINSSWAGDKIIHHGSINIGVAVAIPDGLVVPVLKNADFMNYSQISAGVKDMASRAKSKGLKANEMEGSTFSISNLGMFGIETFTSIINQPNSCILSVGAIIEKPVVKDGQIVVGNTMKLSLACDHRVVDGATGAEFLQTLKTYLENPFALLV